MGADVIPRSDHRLVSRDVTVVLAMASGPPVIEGSPVSIHALPALREIERRSTAQGWSFQTTSEPLGSDQTMVVLWDFGSIAVLSADLERRSNGRIVAWSLESPLVAHRGYHRVEKIAAMSKRVLGYSGVGSLVGDYHDRFETIGWPNRVERTEGLPWTERDLLVMINSNKRLHQWREAFSLREPRRTARFLASSLVARSYGLRRTWTVPDLYEERLLAITELSGDPQFHLFGFGWDKRVPGRLLKEHTLIQAAYRGRAGDKKEVLGRFKFALCIENTEFPGYVSEKLFDCFFSGTIPIYRGAPDVADHVPPEAFIDLRRFSNYRDLLSYLSRIEQDEAGVYLAAADAFMTSDAFERYTESYFVDRVMEAINFALAP